MSRLGIFLSAVSCAVLLAGCERSTFDVEHDVAVPMRDGVVLRADIYRPSSGAKHPVLVYRTPYDKRAAATDYQTHLRAVERGYVVVLQDVRGRYASDGIFDPYRNEGKDGYDTIEWAASQHWANGDVGTYGLSYPGAVQWLAAIESPPQLKAMVPAMTFSSPRNFFYMNGVFDLSWLPWIYFNIAPDARIRLDLAGDTEPDEVAAAWDREGEAVLSHLPLSELPILRKEAPFYFEWLKHAPTDPWWNWAEIRGRYDATDAAVLNLSGWYDEAYGPEGAVTNHRGIVASREGGDARSQLILGPWQHGETEQTKMGELDFGLHSALGYDAVLLDFFDEYLKGAEGGSEQGPVVRYFIMGANEWRSSPVWPPQEAISKRYCFSAQADVGALDDCDRESEQEKSVFVSDPAHPVMDPYGVFEPNDYQALAARDDVLVFDTPVLTEPLTVAGTASVTLHVSCDCADFDLWARLLDVHPDGRAINLMSPGADVQRVSYRNNTEQQLVVPGEIYEVSVDGLLTANQFDAGHRIRVQISASFAPHLSRNLQTGKSETNSSASVAAEITVHHGKAFQSSLQLPVIP